jgi:hypothetical protein
MELYIAGQLRRTALAFQRPCPACSPASSWPVPRVRPGGRDSSYRLARSDRPTGMNPLIAAVRCGGDTGILHLAGAAWSDPGTYRPMVAAAATNFAQPEQVRVSCNLRIPCPPPNIYYSRVHSRVSDRYYFESCRCDFGNNNRECAPITACYAEGGGAEDHARPNRDFISIPLPTKRPRLPAVSRGFDPASCPAKPLVSYPTYRQLSGWIPPPLVIRAFSGHTA